MVVHALKNVAIQPSSLGRIEWQFQHCEDVCEPLHADSMGRCRRLSDALVASIPVAIDDLVEVARDDAYCLAKQSGRMRLAFLTLATISP